ncbi:DUF4440 domain-containing protein [Hyphococcus sp.]|uniref:DUF4440 domain-containing protein n=1 Tax=Hyphococcus sp. TaxID=2038636 RepID=UPI0035C70D4B
MKNRLLICLFALSMFVAPSALAQERRQVPDAMVFGAPASPADGEALEVAFRAYKKAWGTEDTMALMALHTADTEWINAYARMFRGTETLAEFLEERLFPEFSPETSKREAENMALISTRYIGDDAAVLHLYTDGDRGPSVSDVSELRRTHIHLVWEKRDSAWKVAHTAIMDAR